MAYNTKGIKKDVDSKPIPQYYNPTSDAYEVLQGRNGANRVELYGPDGQPISTSGGKIAVRASELETKIDALNAKIDAITDGTTPAVTQLTGSIPEYGWVDGGIEPTPDRFAFGAKVDPATSAITTMYWNGAAWVEVV